MASAFTNIVLFYSLNCCADLCIAKLGFRLNPDNPSIAYEFCKDEMLKFGAKTTKTKTAFINEKLAASLRGVGPNGRQVFKYQIGRPGDNHYCDGVCRRAFEQLYRISERYFVISSSPTTLPYNILNFFFPLPIILSCFLSEHLRGVKRISRRK